jgi:hypothetical protein
MANAWSGHFYKEAQQYKIVYDQVSSEYKQYESQWNSLNLETTHWTEIADLIRWANASARQSYSTGYSYYVNMIEHQKEGSIFGVKKRMESFASANRHIADWTKAAVAKWDKLATEYGVTLVDEKNDVVDIALMADAWLIDIYRYKGSKWEEDESQVLVNQVLEKFGIGSEEFEAWKRIREISEVS